MRIELPLAVLRPYEDADLDALVRQADNPKVAEHLRDIFPHPYTREAGRQWLAHCRTENPVTSFAITADDAVIGGIGITLKDDVYRRSAEIGYWLGLDYWGHGIATQAVRALSDWAFATFDLCRLWAGVFEPNRASARVLEKAGFVFEGRHRQAIFKQGRILDELIYAKIRERD